jgi:hypothetical protein
MGQLADRNDLRIRNACLHEASNHLLVRVRFEGKEQAGGYDRARELPAPRIH